MVAPVFVSLLTDPFAVTVSVGPVSVLKLECIERELSYI